MMKYTLSTSVIASLLSVSCGNNKKCNCRCKQCCDNADSTAIAAGALDFKVADEQNVDLSKYPVDKDGFITLFDDKTLNGWRRYGKDAVPESWNVEDGVIHLVGSGTGKAQTEGGGDLIFARKFKNLELEFEYKISRDGNSGVLYLAQEATTNVDGKNEYPPIQQLTPEYQVLDNANRENTKLGVDDNRQSVFLYNIIPAKPQSVKPFDEWNKGEITVFKDTVIHAQNGEDIVEYHLWTPKWNEMLKNSKSKEDGEFPIAYKLLKNMGGDKHKGYIGSQDHGDDVWYRNVRIEIID